MKTLWIAAASAAVLSAPALAQTKQEETIGYEVTAYQMQIINSALARMLPELGTDFIYSLLVTRVDEAGQELPEQQLIQVGESVRMNYVASVAPPPEACLTKFTKDQTWSDSGAFLRNYLCQHKDYNGPNDAANRKLRQDLYWGTSKDYFGNVAPEVKCIVNGQQNPDINTRAFQKLCFQTID